MATPPVISEEIPESQAKINEELFRFQVELKSEMARAKMKLDLLISMLTENRKSKAEEQPQTTTSDGILFTTPSSAEAECEVAQHEYEIEPLMVSMDLDVDSTLGDVQLIEEQQVEESDSSVSCKMIMQDEAYKVLDEMSKPNPSNFQLGKVYYDAADTGKVELNEIHEMFDEMPDLLTTIQQSFYMESLAPNKPENQLGDEEVQHPSLKMDCLKVVRNLLGGMTPTFGAKVMNEQLMDPYIRVVNFNSITLFDPGGDRKFAMSSSVGVVHELFVKAHKNCDNGLDGVNWGKIVMKNENSIDIQGAKAVPNEYVNVVFDASGLVDDKFQSVLPIESILQGDKSHVDVLEDSSCNVLDELPKLSFNDAAVYDVFQKGIEEVEFHSLNAGVRLMVKTKGLITLRHELLIFDPGGTSFCYMGYSSFCYMCCYSCRLIGEQNCVLCDFWADELTSAEVQLCWTDPYLRNENNLVYSTLREFKNVIYLTNHDAMFLFEPGESCYFLRHWKWNGDFEFGVEQQGHNMMRKNATYAVFSFDPGGYFSHNQEGPYEAIKLSFSMFLCYVCVYGDFHEAGRHELYMHFARWKMAYTTQKSAHYHMGDDDSINPAYFDSHEYFLVNASCMKALKKWFEKQSEMAPYRSVAEEVKSISLGVTLNEFSHVLVRENSHHQRVPEFKRLHSIFGTSERQCIEDLVETFSTLLVLLHSAGLTWEENETHRSINLWIGRVSSWYEHVANGFCGKQRNRSMKQSGSQQSSFMGCSKIGCNFFDETSKPASVDLLENVYGGAMGRNECELPILVRTRAENTDEFSVSINLMINKIAGLSNHNIRFAVLVSPGHYIYVLFLDGVLWVHMIDFPSMSKLEFNPQVYDQATGADLVGILAHSVTSHPFNHGDVIGSKALNKDDVGLPSAITFLVEMLINCTIIVGMVTWHKQLHGYKLVVLTRSTVLNNFVWDPSQDVISLYIIDDNDDLKRKGIMMHLALALALALKQDDISNEAYAHTRLLAFSLVDWEFILLLITSSKFQIIKSYNLRELLVTLRSVELDIIDTMRFKRLMPSSQFGIAFSTLRSEHYTRDPGSYATLIVGLVLMHFAIYVLGMKSVAADGNYYDTTSILINLVAWLWDVEMLDLNWELFMWQFFERNIVSNGTIAPGIFQSRLSLILYCSNSILQQLGVCHFTTLRTRRLLRGRTCHDPRCNPIITSYYPLPMSYVTS